MRGREGGVHSRRVGEREEGGEGEREGEGGTGDIRVFYYGGVHSRRGGGTVDIRVLHYGVHPRRVSEREGRERGRMGGGGVQEG